MAPTISAPFSSIGRKDCLGCGDEQGGGTSTSHRAGLRHQIQWRVPVPAQWSRAVTGLPCILFGSRPDARLTFKIATFTTVSGYTNGAGANRGSCSERRESSPRGRAMV